MGAPGLEVADIFRAHGQAWRQAQHAHLSLGQRKVMSAIEQCRTAALGGHVLRCDTCEQVEIAYNSCRNRHCPKCQASAARRWLEARQAELLPVEYYHVVFTLPAPISAMAYANKAVMYGLLFDIAAETLRDTDTIGRWGGEEFLVLMRDTPPTPDALAAIDRLRLCVQAQAPCAQVPALRYSFSAGIAAHADGQAIDATIAQADQALYAAKRAGRSRTMVAYAWPAPPPVHRPRPLGAR